MNCYDHASLPDTEPNFRFRVCESLNIVPITKLRTKKKLERIGLAKRWFMIASQGGGVAGVNPLSWLGGNCFQENYFIHI